MPHVTALAKEAGNEFFPQRIAGKAVCEIAPDIQLRYEDSKFTRHRRKWKLVRSMETHYTCFAF